jgi:hypothetical protein
MNAFAVMVVTNVGRIAIARAVNIPVFDPWSSTNAT